MKVITVAGYKNTGKTSLVEELVRELGKRGRVGTIKHMHHEEDRGDTARHMKAGADAVIGISSESSRLMMKELSLREALDILADLGMDYAIIEGFKTSELPKVLLGDAEANAVVGKDLSAEEILQRLDEFPEWETVKSLIRKVKSSPKIGDVGAIGCFIGVVREEGVVKALEIEKYGGVAERIMREIEEEVKKEFGVIEVRMHHNSGRLVGGEDIVYIVVAASHRKEMFEALREAVERMKQRVPVWKKEIRIDGERWV
ncbi:MAG: molybdopterin synthase catalytic subunit [Archaeoglobi archaeon]|nr:molybdopterin synthase [Candidatus Mnemosynella bozhongmuii]MDI3502578.1 molybdopterin synthase catalytic subunit [Archaeoglobi archaeon]MDK2781719.1 molybdopterin synthase catalytic subunit [Archaeoglobi archaeon]